MRKRPSLRRSPNSALWKSCSIGSEPLDVAVGFQCGKKYVEEPQAHKEPCCGKLAATGTSELPAQVGPPTVQEHTEADKCKDGEKSDREG